MLEILMIEDDEEIASLLTKYLNKHNMKILNYTNPADGLESLKINRYDLVLLDLSLPEMDGLDVCKIISEQYDIPIIISSARSDTTDKVIGLEFGADDYLPKPYDPRELVARIKAVLRRKNEASTLSKSDFKIYKHKMLISFKNKILDLTTAEFEILNLLLQNKNIVVTREYIANNSNSIRWDSSDRSIDVIVSRIRYKIGDNAKQPKYIKSIRGVGYKFIAE